MELYIPRDTILNPTRNDIDQLREVLVHLEQNHWLQHQLFTWQWWVLLVATIVPWITFIWKVDKKRITEILFYGLIWMIVAVALDALGTTKHVWDYPIQLIHVVPPLVPADLCVIPVTYMFLYQKTNRWLTYIIGAIIVAAVFSFVVEVLFLHYNMLEFHKGRWTHTASLLSFIALSILIRWVHVWIWRKNH